MSLAIKCGSYPGVGAGLDCEAAASGRLACHGCLAEAFYSTLACRGDDVLGTQWPAIMIHRAARWWKEGALQKGLEKPAPRLEAAALQKREQIAKRPTVYQSQRMSMKLQRRECVG